MNVTQAIKQRHSTRAYLDEAVSQQQVESILESARFAPSGVNTQPWQVAIVSGQSKSSLQQQMQTAFESGEKESMDYHYYPTDWVEPYKSRRIATGTELYKALKISREDKERRIQQWQANYRAFDAPIMLLFFMDPVLETGSYLDYGMFLQNIMLLAEEEGLATCPQGALGEFPKLIKNFLNYDESLILLGGMALGYEDKEHAVNQYRTPRVEVAEFSQFFE
ncbi:MAG: nitroreductase [Thiomicrorhabdus sp.]|jgi:nitroreductase|nr:nitroreductase [Thiomicrorhabdus sp.]